MARPQPPSAEHVAIGNRIKEQAIKLRINAKELAYRLGKLVSKETITDKQVRNYYNGYYLSPRVIELCAKVFNCHVSDLMPIKQESALIYCPPPRQADVSSFKFDGSDVFALLSLIQKLDDKKVLSEATVKVDGLRQYTGAAVQLTGRITRFTFDDLVRSFILSSNAGALSVGGDNAALEDVRSFKTTVALPREYVQEVLKNNTFFTLYLPNTMVDFDMVKPYLLNEYLMPMAITALKKLKEPQQGVEYLSANAQSMINATGEAQLIADAFKSFSTCYEKEQIAEATFSSLEKIFNDLMTQGEVVAAVYALESMGYCTRYHNRLIHKLLEFSTKLMSDMGNTLKTAHKDLRLALYAAFNQPREIVVFSDIIKKIRDVNYQLMELALFDSYDKIHIVSYR